MQLPAANTPKNKEDYPACEGCLSMSKRSGWNRRWHIARGPSLENLEDRVVLAQASAMAWQGLLSHLEQNHTPDIAPVPPAAVEAITGGKGDLGYLAHPGPSSDPSLASASSPSLNSGSLSAAKARIAAEPISISIEATLPSLSPSSATIVASAIQALATLAQGTTATKTSHLADTSANKHSTSARSLAADTPPETTANAATEPAPAGEGNAAGKEANPSRETSPPPEAAIPVDAVRPTSELVKDSDETSRSPAVGAPMDSGRSGVLPSLIGQDAGNISFSGMRFYDATLARDGPRDAENLLFVELGTLEPTLTVPARSSPAEELAMPAATNDSAAAPPPLSSDLILDFLPYNVTAVRTALEDLVTRIEHLCLQSSNREGLSLGLLLAALASSGMAGHAAWERLRGRREPRANFADPDRRTATWLDPSTGLPSLESP
jgi:hypothetical protein